MKVLFLADPSSIHTIRWANSLYKENIKVYLFGLNEFDKLLYSNQITSENLNISPDIKNGPSASLYKAIYLTSLIKIRQYIKKVNPDILHAHYISSYGLLGSLTDFHPYIISVWGSDIFYVPKKNFLHKKLIEYSLAKADKILSTSNFMAEQINKYTNKGITITPFGIDTNRFKSIKINSPFGAGNLIIGSTKALEEKYGNEYLIRAFRLVKNQLPATSMKLLIIGSGSQETHLKKLVKELNLSEDTLFTGFIQHTKIHEFYNMLDIYVALSTENESFGVSVLEAMACEKPVIVSSVGGFKEIVRNCETGLIVGKKNTVEVAEAIIKLALDKNLRMLIGRNGRQFVEKNYDWDSSVRIMLKVYEQTLDESGRHS